MKSIYLPWDYNISNYNTSDPVRYPISHYSTELVAPDAKEVEAEETAEDIKEARKERLTTFTFALCGIAPGSEIEFCCRNNPYSGAICKVIDDRNIEYENESWSLTALAKHFTGSCSNIAGTRYFKYRGEWLHKLRERLGV